MKNFVINFLDWYKIINNYWDDFLLVLYVCFRYLVLFYVLVIIGVVGIVFIINNMVKVGICIIKISDIYL